MNWKNVVNLLRVELKSGRLLRGGRFSMWENKLLTYGLYGLAIALGIAVGALFGYFFSFVPPVDSQLRNTFQQGLLSIFFSVPTFILIFSLVFTMMQQIQRSGTKFSTQAPYWLPITWEEHTLASILSNLLGFPLIVTAFVSSALIAVSLFTGQVMFAVLSVFAALASAFMASTITEMFRILQVRFTGAVYKSSGRAAVWVRFAGTLAFFIVFYIVYFYVISGVGALGFFQTVVAVQNVVWFVPFIWLGVALYSFISGFFVEAVIFVMLSALFILVLFYGALLLNRKFGLYEPPAITVSRGAYAPRSGFLGRLGFSTTEAALIRKDFKAFTRRRELTYIFVLPIVFVLVPLMQSFSSSQMPSSSSFSSLFQIVYGSLLPVAIFSIFLGGIIVGEEGHAIWRVYASPISAESLVKSKYFFIIFFGTLVTIIVGTVDTLAFHSSTDLAFVAFLEGFLLMFPLAAISLSIGLMGPDFREEPRPRFIKVEWSLLNMILCFIAAIGIVSPFIPVAISSIFASGSQNDLFLPLGISTVISIIVTTIAYRIAVSNARGLLLKAQM
jgi:hypothetical protein